MHRKRLVRFNNPGEAHSLTFSCFRRQKFLDRDRTRQWLVQALDAARTEHLYHIWSYVIMPEHAHVLVWPTKPKYDIADFLSSVKQSVAKKALIFVRRDAPLFLVHMRDEQPNGKVHHRFWQRGAGHDRNIVEPSTAHVEIEYQHNNPVRRALCERPEDWFWSSAADHLGIRAGPLRIDRDSIPRLSVR
jgi:putative transposase